MKTFDIIFFAIIAIIILSLIDRWYYRKIVIIDRIRLDSERFRVNAKTHSFFNLIKVKMDYIEKDGEFYTITKDGPFSHKEIIDTHCVEPRFVKQALLKYNLEKGLND